uniref:Lipoprotein n=1 Tax=Acidobacterium capsulatum TaxID=33075 RepID=A0A7V5CTC8_9BACT
MKRLAAWACSAFVTVSVMFSTGAFAQSAASSAAPDANAQKGRAVLAKMVEALGGEKWLAVRNVYTGGNIAGFFHGNPDGSMLRFYDWSVPLGPERREETKQKNVVEIYQNHACTEVTYRGAHPQQKKICAEYWRLRDHSLDAALRAWRNDPQTLVTYDGQVLSERRLADQVTLLNEQNDAITLQADTETHLPMQVSFTYRDPEFGDKDTDVVEFNNYHLIDGIQTPFTLTYLHNGEMVEQRYLLRAAYNVPLPPHAFDVQAAVQAIAR